MNEQRYSDERKADQRQIHETRVQELQREVQLLFDSAPAMIWYKDTQNRILRVNQVAADSIGLPKTLIEGRAVADFYPQDADRYYRDDCIVIESGLPKFGIVEPYRLPSGEERWLHTDKVPLKNGEGTVTGILVMAVDITERQRAEQALSVSREELRRALAFDEAVMAHMGEGLYTVDVHGLVTFMNPAAERLFGWTFGELRGRKMHDVTHYKHRDGTAFAAEDCAGFKVLQEGQKLTDHEDAFIRKDGTFLDVSYSSSPLHEGKEIRGLVVVFRDISAHKHIEAALRESEARYRETFANAAVGIAHVGLDGRWIRVNEAVCRITGYTRKELHTMTFADVTHPDDIETDWSHANRLLAGEIATYSLEKRYVQKKGGLAWINLTVSLQRDAAGSPQNFISVIEDITARKQTEDALRDSETRFRTLADNISQFAWIANADGWIIWYNRRWYEYTGTTFEDMQGWGWQKVHHPEHVDRVVETWRRAHATGEPWEDTFPLRGRDGTYRWFLSRARPIRDEKGTTLRWFGTNTDVTDLREAQATLQNREEQLQLFSTHLQEMVAARTDELQQSEGRLRAMASERNLVEQRERKRLATELHDYLAQLLVLCRINLGQVKRVGLPAKAEAIVDQTEQVVDQALDYSRTLMAELSPTVLQEHGLPSALTWLGTQMQRHGLAVTVDLGGTNRLSLPEEHALLLFQSVRELLMNALKHAKCKAVVVRVHTVDNTLHLQVRDDGIGFDVMAKNITSSASTLSSGFGLFSIEERMRDLGGWFDLESTPGQGTSATLTVELKRPTAAGDGLIHPTTAPRFLPQRRVLWNSASIRILLVDDHAMVRQGLRTMLESYPGVQVVGEACNGEEAVQAAEMLQPSLIVMDINMPKMNGIEATAAIKTRFHDIIIIGLSVQAGGANAEAMTKAGAAMLLTKEAAVDELYERIQQVVKEAQHDS